MFILGNKSKHSTHFNQRVKLVFCWEVLVVMVFKENFDHYLGDNREFK